MFQTFQNPKFFRLRRWFALTFNPNMYNFRLRHYFFSFCSKFSKQKRKIEHIINYCSKFESKNIYFDLLARRRRIFFAIRGIILSIFINTRCVFCSCLSLFCCNQTQIIREKNLKKKNTKSYIVLKRPKMLFLERQKCSTKKAPPP